MMETMREMQFTIEKDTSMCDYFDKLDSQVKVRTHAHLFTGIEKEEKDKHCTDVNINTSSYDTMTIWSINALTSFCL